MNKSIVHRGPDEQLVFTENTVGLGQLHLFTSNSSKINNRSMTYEHNGRRLAITYSGDVHNYPDIRKDLEEKGYTFNSDTIKETLIASYLEYGTECIQNWNGSFAFVIYDPEEQILWGARDRFGQKPLKYYFDDRQFIFSSELKAILENGIKREVDYDAIDDYLTLQYVPAPKTGFKNIFKLPNAHYFILDIKSRSLKTIRYFNLIFSNKIELNKKEWLKRIDKALSSVVKNKSTPGVNQGILLSGGVDSSAITALMSKYLDNIKTFSISFDAEDFNETKFAKIVADKYKTQHTVFNVKPNDLIKNFERLVYQYEEPYADPSQLATYVLVKMTKQYVDLVITGNGGDEIFGGHPKYHIHRLINFLKIVIYILKPFKNYIKNEKVRVVLNTIDKSIARRHYNFTNYFDEFTKREIYTNEMINQLSEDRKNVFEELTESVTCSDLEKVMYLDFNAYIPNCTGVKLDMACMSNSLKVCSPMLDHEFVLKMAQMPCEYKVGMFSGKLILKKTLEKYLPKTILYRKKSGFSIPIKHWFRNELKEYIKDSILNENGIVLEIIKRDNVKRLIESHLRGRDNSKKLWALMSLNMWYETYFKTNKHKPAI